MFTPDDGKQGKGVNCILSLVWHEIQKYNCGVITCDNCVGQNKNNYSLFFYLWLINDGLMKLRHKKFIGDSRFDFIKIL